MTDREKFLILIYNEPLKKANAIILLQGDGYFRIPWAYKLYKEKWAPRIVVSSDIKNLTYGSYPNLAKKLKEAGVPSKNIITELQSTNTYEEAVNIIEMCIKKKWKKIILVASHYHQPRAFLTFLKVLKKRKINLQIINSPVKDLSWFKKNKWGVRLNLLDQEFKKIDNYKKKGHIASYKEAIKYQEWKEKKK